MLLAMFQNLIIVIDEFAGSVVNQDESLVTGA
jgi:hypothetical protein